MNIRGINEIATVCLRVRGYQPDECPDVFDRILANIVRHRSKDLSQRVVLNAIVGALPTKKGPLA